MWSESHGICVSCFVFISMGSVDSFYENNSVPLTFLSIFTTFQIVEKLSAKAPDGQSKIKILTAIAEEHNIKWDPKSFGDNINPPADLLVNFSFYKNYFL